MTMILATLAVFAPQARHAAVIEDAAVAQPAVGQQGIDHWRQRAAQPFADRRLEPMLRPIDDGLRDAPLQQTPQEVLTLAVL